MKQEEKFKIFDFYSEPYFINGYVVTNSFKTSSNDIIVERHIFVNDFNQKKQGYGLNFRGHRDSFSDIDDFEKEYVLKDLNLDIFNTAFRNIAKENNITNIFQYTIKVKELDRSKFLHFKWQFPELFDTVLQKVENTNFKTFLQELQSINIQTTDLYYDTPIS